MEEFLSDEWLDRNIAAAEMMPPDHKIELTQQEYYAALAELNPAPKHEISADIWLHWLLQIKGSRLHAPRMEWRDPGVAHVAVNGGLTLEQIVRIFGDKKNWNMHSVDEAGRAVWIWKGPVTPPWELATWGKRGG